MHVMNMRTSPQLHPGIHLRVQQLAPYSASYKPIHTILPHQACPIQDVSKTPSIFEEPFSILTRVLGCLA